MRINQPSEPEQFGFARALMCAALLGVPALTGCSTIHTEIGSPLPESSATLTEGETHVQTVIETLGPPHAVSALSDGFVFLYEYSYVSEFQFGFSLKLINLPYFKLIKGNSKLSEMAHMLTFNKDGVLVAYGTAAWREKLSGGNALQFIASVLSLTDTSSFKEVPDSLFWGRGYLQPPPVILNSGQDMRSGMNGLEQRTTPAFAGQETLEMRKPTPMKVKRRKTMRK